MNISTKKLTFNERMPVKTVDELRAAVGQVTTFVSENKDDDSIVVTNKLVAKFRDLLAVAVYQLTKRNQSAATFAGVDAVKKFKCDVQYYTFNDKRAATLSNMSTDRQSTLFVQKVLRNSKLATDFARLELISKIFNYSAGESAYFADLDACNALTGFNLNRTEVLVDGVKAVVYESLHAAVWETDVGALSGQRGLAVINDTKLPQSAIINLGLAWHQINDVQVARDVAQLNQLYGEQLNYVDEDCAVVGRCPLAKTEFGYITLNFDNKVNPEHHFLDEGALAHLNKLRDNILNRVNVFKALGNL